MSNDTIPAPPESAKKPHLFVAVLAGGGRVAWTHGPFTHELRSICAINGIDLTIQYDPGTGVDRARNKLASRIVDDESFTHMLQLDDDIVAKPHDIVKMVRTGLDVVSGIYPRKTIEWAQVADAVKRGVPVEELEDYSCSFIFNQIVDNEGRANARDFGHLGTFVEVEEVGTGCLMVTREALLRYIEHYRERIEYVTDYAPRDRVHHNVFLCQNDPGAERERAATALLEAAKLEPDGSGGASLELGATARAYREAAAKPASMGRLLTEDYSFCRRWRLMGGKVYAGIDIELQHVGGYVFKGKLRKTLGLNVVDPEKTPTLKVCPPEHAGVMSVLAGSYDVPELDALEKPCVLDIGANIGAFSAWIAKRRPGCTIAAFEPHPDHVALLRQNVEGTDCDVMPFAVDARRERGRSMLFDGMHNPGERSLKQMGEQLSTGVVVDTFPAANLPTCDVMKLDTEGCEVDILRAYPHLAKVRVLMLEWHSKEDYALLTAWLPAMGLRLVRDDTKGVWARDRNLVFVHDNSTQTRATNVVETSYGPGDDRA